MLSADRVYFIYFPMLLPPPSGVIALTGLEVKPEVDDKELDEDGFFCGKSLWGEGGIVFIHFSSKKN